VEVVDRYLAAVSSWLPAKQRQDVVAELREDVRSEIEERERERGRRLSEGELHALVKRRGHPMWVAERYLPTRHLIGPAMWPAYWRTVRIAVGVILALFVVLYFVFSGPARRVAPVLSSPGIWVWLFGLWSLAYVGLFTLIFAFVERRHTRARATGEWDPRNPDGLPGTPPDPDVVARRRVRANGIVDVVSDVLILSWWLGFHLPAIPELGIVLTPVWHALHWPVALYLAGSIAAGLADAIRPSLERSRVAWRLALDAFALLLVGSLLSAWPWVRITGPGIPPDKAATGELWMNLTWLAVLLVAAVACAVRVFRLERRVARGEAASPGPRAAGA
jgi:hypothetical protein